MRFIWLLPRRLVRDIAEAVSGERRSDDVTLTALTVTLTVIGGSTKLIRPQFVPNMNAL